MIVTVVAVGRLREAYIRDGCQLYLKRLRPLVPVTVLEVRSAKHAGDVAAEADAMLKVVGSDDLLWALDQRGEAMSSNELARSLAAAERSGRRRLVFAIGGPSGLGPKLVARADVTWSLSELTFLHEMARLIALEQIYRAIKINRGEPYHR